MIISRYYSGRARISGPRVSPSPLLGPRSRVGGRTGFVLSPKFQVCCSVSAGGAGDSPPRPGVMSHRTVAPSQAARLKTDLDSEHSRFFSESPAAAAALLCCTARHELPATHGLQRCDFMYQVKDTTECLTPWTSAFVGALRTMSLPLRGVVGPSFLCYMMGSLRPGAARGVRPHFPIL
jgi:hypothetical protein